MTLIDSLDSIIMLYSYAGFPEHRFALLEDAPVLDKQPSATQPLVDADAPASPGTKTPSDVEHAAAAPRKSPSPTASLQELPRSAARSPARRPCIPT